MDETTLDAWIDAGTAALGLTVEPEWRQAVRMHLRISLGHAATVLAAGLTTIWSRRRCTAHDASAVGPWSTGTEIAAAVGSGKVSATAIIDAALARIATVDKKLNAFTDVTAERARDARRRDRCMVAAGKSPGRWPACRSP